LKNVKLPEALPGGWIFITRISVQHVRNIEPAQRKTKNIQTYVTYVHRPFHAWSAYMTIFLTLIYARMEEKKLERFQMRQFGFSVVSE